MGDLGKRSAARPRKAPSAGGKSAIFAMARDTALPRYPMLSALFLCLLVSFPFYFFNSGGAQISTLFGVFVIAVILPDLFRLVQKPQAMIGGVFVIYTLIVNAAFDVLGGYHGSMIQFTIFYAYNFSLFLAVLKCAEQGPVFNDIVRRAVVLSVAAQIAFVPVFFVAGGRNTLFFNNPNQLGYWGLVTALIMTLTSRKKGRSIGNVEGLVLLGCLALVYISQSKGALAGMLLLIGMRATTSLRSLVIVVMVGLAAFVMVSGSDTFNSIQARFERIGTDDDTVAARGYSRLLAHPEYLVFGAGEGGLDRWRGLEIHSVPGMLLFSYGIVGTLIFLIWLWRLTGPEHWAKLLVLVPLVPYEFTHQGLRSSVLWVFVGLLAIVSLRPDKPATRAPAPIVGGRTRPPRAPGRP